MTGALALSLGAAPLALGLLRLRAAWRAPPDARWRSALGGWSLIAAALGLWRLGSGLDLALARFALVFSLGAFGVLAASMDVRPRRPRRGEARRAPLASPVPRYRPWRIAGRMVLAGPLSLAFGLAVCVAFAARAPLAEVDAVILAGLAAPVAIAVAMAWSLMDRRASRVAISLVASTLALLAVSRI